MTPGTETHGDRDSWDTWNRDTWGQGELAQGHLEVREAPGTGIPKIRRTGTRGNIWDREIRDRDPANRSTWELDTWNVDLWDRDLWDSGAAGPRTWPQGHGDGATWHCHGVLPVPAGAGAEVDVLWGAPRASVSPQAPTKAIPAAPQALPSICPYLTAVAALGAAPAASGRGCAGAAPRDAVGTRGQPCPGTEVAASRGAPAMAGAGEDTGADSAWGQAWG